ncbi:MAG TPA: hypothetical protein VEP90_09475 [Methylomirabilota bacterium]|nr:hypothetical protein [Methylomirabilota bacterium]
MSVSEQIQALTENIEASYGPRIAAVSDIVEETHQTLGNFHREHEKMARDLKRSLASNRSARVSQVQKMRAAHKKELKEIAPKIAELLSAAETERREEFTTLMGEIEAAVAAIEKDTAQTLADFRNDHKEMADSLRSELSSFQRTFRRTVDDMMADFSADHRQAHIHWENLTKEMAAKRAGKLASSPKEEG